jgi:hypothetical protein
MLDEWYGQRVKSYLLLKGNTNTVLLQHKHKHNFSQFFSFEKRYREINFRGRKKKFQTTLEKAFLKILFPSLFLFPQQ